MMKIHAFIIFIFFVQNLHAQTEISLRLQKGRTYCTTTSNTTTITRTEGGVEQQTINIEKGGFCYKIIEDHDSVFLAETFFTFFGQTIQSPDMNTTASSDHPEEGGLSKILSSYINKPFLVWLRNDYSWIKTQGLDSIFLHSYDDYKLPDTTRKYLDSVILEMVKDFTRNDANLSAVLYSKNKIIPGNVWTTSTSSEHVIPTNDNLSYYLSETGGDLFTVKGTGTTQSTDDITNDGVEISTYEMSGTTEVTVTYYKTDCWMKNGSLITELTGKGYLKNISTGVIRTVPMKIKTEATIEGYRVN